MFVKSSFARLILVLLASVGVVGCGGKQQRYQVAGHIVLDDGTPVVGASLSLESQDGTIHATAITNENGEFALGALKPGDGLPAGEYRALVMSAVDFDAANPPPPPFHSKYSRYQTSGLKFTIQADTDQLEIRLKPSSTSTNRR